MDKQVLQVADKSHTLFLHGMNSHWQLTFCIAISCSLPCWLAIVPLGALLCCYHCLLLLPCMVRSEQGLMKLEKGLDVRLLDGARLFGQGGKRLPNALCSPL